LVFAVIHEMQSIFNKFCKDSELGMIEGSGETIDQGLQSGEQRLPANLILNSD
jgi:hypothetical protein